MVTHSMENILSMQYYAPVGDEALHSPPSRKKRCIAKEQDPMSHRIIEKRRRDRMNNCLADLSRLIPAEYLKKGRGRVEKTEIIEMAIRHMKHLQGLRQDSKHHTPVSTVHAVHGEDSVDSVSHPAGSPGSSAAEHYRLGYQECLSETMHFLVEVEGYFARDALCVQLISHLQQHCDKILATSDRLGFPHPVDLPTSNGTACNGTAGVNSFSHANGGPLTGACPNGNGVSANGLGLHGSGGHNNNNNSHSHGNLNNVTGHSQHHSMLHGNGGSSSSSSDRCSSSGVSSFDSSEARPQRALNIPPPCLVSDDSNHSCHSHASYNGCGAQAPLGPGHQLHHQLDHQFPQQQQQLGQQQPRPRQPANYKFKNSIKQRFSAERVKTSCSPPPASSCGSSGPESKLSPGAHQGVPIFALHDNGGFYVPLTVEAALIRPHMGSSPGDLGPEAVLHPVTISVNFNHASTPVWSHPSPPHQMQ